MALEKNGCKLLDTYSSQSEKLQIRKLLPRPQAAMSIPLYRRRTSAMFYTNTFRNHWSLALCSYEKL